jgi:transitional endoplasmic reticulum ATPase
MSNVSNHIVQQRNKLSAEADKIAQELDGLYQRIRRQVEAPDAEVGRFRQAYADLCAAKSRARYQQAWEASRKRSTWLEPLAAGAKSRFNTRLLAWCLIALAFFGTYWVLRFIGLSILSGPIALFPAVMTYRSWRRKARTLYAQRNSQADRDALEGLAPYQACLTHFSPTPSGDANYPYSAVTIKAGGADAMVFNGWNLNKTTYGELFGASFLIFYAPEDLDKTALVLRLQAPAGKPEIIDIKDAHTARFKPLREDLLALARAHGEALVASMAPLGDLLDSRRALLRKQTMLKAKLDSLESQEQAWSKVAVSSPVLDEILLQIDLFRNGGAGAPRGLLLFGPPGTGKTSIARNLATSSGCNFVNVRSADLKGQYQGQTAPKVAALWKEARSQAPCVMFIDECEGIFGSRSGGDSVNFNDELVQAFLAEWDGMNSVAGQVFVVGATNRREGLDTAVVSRFNQLIEIALPDAGLRARILALEFKKCAIDLPVTEAMAKETAGMSGRDLQNIVVRFQSAAYTGQLDAAAFSKVVKSVRGKASTLTDHVTWEQVILPEAVKRKLQALANKIKRAEEYMQRGLPVPKNLLLYGPPGTGKTQIARALASESGIAFLAVSTAEVKGRHIGESGARIKALFERARTQAPCLVFIDEIDVVTGSRGQSDSFTQEIIGQLLQEMDGIGSREGAGKVFILGATNVLDSIDPAVLSRFVEKEEIGLPTAEARAAILRVLLTNKPLGFDLDASLEQLAGMTAGFSGRDLASLVNSAANGAMERADAAGLDIDQVRIELDDLTPPARKSPALAAVGQD